MADSSVLHVRPDLSRSAIVCGLLNKLKLCARHFLARPRPEKLCGPIQAYTSVFLVSNDLKCHSLPTSWQILLLLYLLSECGSPTMTAVSTVARPSDLVVKQCGARDYPSLASRPEEQSSSDKRVS